MEQIFHKSIAVLMSFVVLFSTMSFTIDMHYCGDTLMDTAIFHKVKTCGMDMEKAINGSECSITKKGCCKDEQILVKGQNELKISYDKLTFDQQFFITSFVHSYLNIIRGFENNITSYKKYVPPLVTRQLYKLDETYLI